MRNYWGVQYFKNLVQDFKNLFDFIEITLISGDLTEITLISSDFTYL